jgi:hypothetical protein
VIGARYHLVVPSAPKAREPIPLPRSVCRKLMHPGVLRQGGWWKKKKKFLGTHAPRCAEARRIVKKKIHVFPL